MDYPYKFVEFEHYCRKCEHQDTPHDEDPCDECLTNPVNLNSHRPVNFKEKE